MFSTVRRFIKTAILFLFVGLVYGGWLLYRREISGSWPTPHQVSAHSHLVAIGFVMFLILGVALWMFPRPAKDDDRYRPRRIEVAWWLLAPATALRFVAEAPVSTRDLGQLARLGDRRGGGDSIRGVRALLPHHVAADPASGKSAQGGEGREVLSARHTRSGVKGSRSMRTPTAS